MTLPGYKELTDRIGTPHVLQKERFTGVPLSVSGSEYTVKLSAYIRNVQQLGSFLTFASELDLVLLDDEVRAKERARDLFAVQAVT